MDHVQVQVTSEDLQGGDLIASLIPVPVLHHLSIPISCESQVHLTASTTENKGISKLTVRTCSPQRHAGKAFS